MTSAETAEGSPRLDLQIRSVEQQILERRQRMGAIARRLGRNVRARMVAPEMLTVAVGLGVYLQHRGARHPGGSIATLVNSVYASRSLVMTLSSWIKSPAVASDDVTAPRPGGAARSTEG